MRDGKFEASDFALGQFIEPRLMVYHAEDRPEIIGIVNQRAAELANALLPALREQIIAELKQDGVRVYMQRDGLLGWLAGTNELDLDTHTAIIPRCMIEELK